MSTAVQTAYAENESSGPHWSLISRLAFRFCFIYFGLFCVGTQILSSLFSLPGLEIPSLNTFWPMRPIVFWVAAHVFQLQLPLIYTGSGSGDKTFDWVFAFSALSLAVMGTVLWSILDRTRENYTTLSKWFRLFIRFALAGQMLTYGFAKVIPLQMPFPDLTKLLEPIGSLSPMGMLWTSIGASPAYETFAGCAEALGGILLIFPRTTTLGAMVCLADMIQVFMLNMTYDVPVKLLSSHLALMSLILLAPELSRLRDFFFLNRNVASSAQPPLFATRRANRAAILAQCIFGFFLAGTDLYGSLEYQKLQLPKSPLYGIWNVDEVSTNSPSPPSADPGQWHRAVFDRPGFVVFQRNDDSRAGYNVMINPDRGVIVLTNRNRSGSTSFKYQRADGQLILDGVMDGHETHIAMRLANRGLFPLVNRGFHWIQEYPFNH
jgi:uncharacterized membrane protein YphA (DoxX/SURF4 family)